MVNIDHIKKDNIIMVVHKDKNDLKVTAIPDKGHPESYGHAYALVMPDKDTKTLEFQNGTIPIEGVNGFTNESLLAILIHRTNELNNKFPCRENEMAITKMEEAKMWFDKRTLDRIEREVEGMDVK